MNKHNKANYEYWKNRAESAESQVERQNKFISDQVVHIDELTTDMNKLRKELESYREPGGE